MQINIQGHNFELTPAIREYAIKKISKLEEFYKNIIKTEITLDIRSNDDLKKMNVCEVNLWASGKKALRASNAGETMYAAIDLVFEEMKKQLIKHKEKHVKEVRRSAEKTKEILRSTPAVETGDKSAKEVVKLKRFDIKNMTLEEAIAEQKLLGHEFFIYRSADTGEVTIIHGDKIMSKDEIKFLSENEAIKELKSLNASFIPFVNPDTEEINILYKRKSGNLGLIEPSL